MTLRAKIVLALIIGLGVILVIGLVIGIMSFVKKSGNGNSVQSEDTLQESAVPDENPQDDISRNDQVESDSSNQAVEPTDEHSSVQETAPASGDDKQTVVAIILPFVERFGTYSSQGQYENLENLLPFMTEEMKVWAQSVVKKATSEPANKQYVGVTTKALAYTILSLREAQGTGEVKVSTQRVEMVGLPTNKKVYTQDILVKLKKEEGVWLVDGAYWQ